MIIEPKAKTDGSYKKLHMTFHKRQSNGRLSFVGKRTFYVWQMNILINILNIRGSLT